MIGPQVRPAPPMTVASKNRIDCENGKELGAMNPVSVACRPPARPALAAASTKAAVSEGAAAVTSKVKEAVEGIKNLKT